MSSSVLFFFFKQKTAYEMRISDWSSDVCSSDLEYNGGCVWRAIVWQAALPILGQRFGFVRDGLDVVGKRQGDDVCLQDVNNSPGLLASTAMAHIEPDLVTRVGLPLPGTAGLNLLQEFKGGIVVNVGHRPWLGPSLHPQSLGRTARWDKEV